MRPPDSVLAKCIEHLTPHMVLPRPLIGHLGDKWPTPQEPFADHDRVTAEIFAHLRPHVSEIRAVDIVQRRLEKPAYEGIFRKVGRGWFGNLDSDILFDAAYVGAVPANLLYTVPRAVFADPLFLSRLWDPSVLNNPRVS